MINVDAIKIFTQDPKKGALAGVVLDAAPLSEHTMQMVAKTVDASETAFIFPSECADFRLRWFTPSNEVGICVHATIGAVAAWVKANNSTKQSLLIETRNDILAAKIEGVVIYINVPKYKIDDRQVSSELISDHFKIPKSELEGAPRVIKIYEDRELVVPLKSLATLEQLKPSVEEYSAICQAFDVTGLALFAHETFNPSNDIHLREFAPLYGYLEDPLCGMAAGCVFTHLRAENKKVTTLRVEQGHFCGTDGIIYVKFTEESSPWIGGEYCFGNPIQITL